MHVLTIIPARGGSKRLPKKNLLSVAGKPLLVHSIEQARRARRVTRTVVSTEDAEIAAVSQAAGAEVVVRPAELAGDAVTSEAVLLHVLDEMKRCEGYEPDVVVFLQCTSPIRRADDIDRAVQRLFESGADSVFSATESKWLLWRSAGPWVESLNYDYRKRKREQDMAAEWRENGSIYVFRPALFREQMNRLGGKIAVYEMDYWSSFQIDSREDLELCEWIIRRQMKCDRLAALPETIGAVVFDFDGVFTDNRVWVFTEGGEAVVCSRGDGLGLDRLRSTGIPLLVLSTESDPVVAARCRKVQVECRQGLRNKIDALVQFTSERGIALRDVVYIGNDLNDRDCLAEAGCGIVVADAHPSVRDQARIVLESLGGKGAVREVCDLILEKLQASV
jgi:N-acylneuraminate cytidylyltransferase